MKKNYIIILGVLLLLLSGCIKENRDDCGEFSFILRHTINSSYSDKLSSELECANIYLFDKNGILIDTIYVNKNDIKRGVKKIDLKPGVWSAVAWGSNSGSLASGGYTTNREDKIADFRMALSSYYDENSCDKQFSKLFYASALNFNYCTECNSGQILDFAQTTNQINISVGSSNNGEAKSSQQESYKLSIRGKGGVYDHLHHIDKSAPRLTFEPSDTLVENNKVKEVIKIQKIDIATHQTSPLLLYIETESKESTKSAQITTVDLLDALQAIKDEKGNYKYSSQEDFDRESIYNLDISLGLDLKATITINGYKIESVDATISGK